MLPQYLCAYIRQFDPVFLQNPEQGLLMDDDRNLAYEGGGDDDGLYMIYLS